MDEQSEHPKKKKKLKSKFYEKELQRLQVELVKLQEWIKKEGLKVVVIFEGRDAAGKGGTIKRITDKLNPRICRIVALQKPTEKERGQWIFRDMWHIFRRKARWCFLTGAGTTGRWLKK
jgi:polyphosphate kinase 2 (PPK2 family)